ncbi:MAG: ribonuclease catalytic domain-containing protein [Chloroflexota bacterium]
MSTPLTPGSLLLYKRRPARLVKTGERLDIEIEGGNTARVRDKDITLLHPGPLNSLKELHAGLQALQADPALAWELLSESGGSLSLRELSELAFDRFTPATAWAAWEWVEDGLLFQGTPQVIQANPVEAVQRERAVRQARQAETQAWRDFLARAAQGTVSLEQDARYLREVEDLALGRRADSRVLKELSHSERPETAHALLLTWGAWEASFNPYPARLGAVTQSPQIELPPLPDEPRLDLTHLPAYAIDDKLNQDPDDALSLVSIEVDAGELRSARVWVHVADAAALAPPDSPADLEARRRGATLYLPEGPVTMLPPGAVQTLGLGLHPISPALSFDITIDAQAQVTEFKIAPSWVRVERLSYDAAEERLHEPDLHGLAQVAEAFNRRRERSGAFLLDLPESIIKVIDGQVQIESIRRLRSREMVRELMLLAGEAVARFAIEQRLPFPFATQEPPALPANPPPELARALGLPTAELTMAQRFAMRRLLKRSQVSLQPGEHSGVGLSAYSRLTSPLRRYLDLAAHQQLRRLLRGERPLNESEMIERIGYSEAIIGVIARTESLSRRHWTLVHLMRQPEWSGEAVLVEKRDGRGYAIFPELAFETPVPLRSDLPLDSLLQLRVKSINLPDLEAHFTPAA